MIFCDGCDVCVHQVRALLLAVVGIVRGIRLQMGYQLRASPYVMEYQLRRLATIC
jgi:hypothetical protein